MMVNADARFCTSKGIACSSSADRRFSYILRSQNFQILFMHSRIVGNIWSRGIIYIVPFRFWDCALNVFHFGTLQKTFLQRLWRNFLLYSADHVTIVTSKCCATELPITLSRIRSKIATDAICAHACIFCAPHGVRSCSCFVVASENFFDVA